MKKTVLIQNIPHFTTPWGDSWNAWNMASIFKGISNWQSREYTQKLAPFHKLNYNIVIDRHPDDEFKLIIKKSNMPIERMNELSFSIDVDLRTAMQYLDENPKVRSCAFAFHIKNTDTPGTVIFQESEWIARNHIGKITYSNTNDIDEEINSKLIKVSDGSIIDKDSEHIQTIVWFFMYKTTEHPIYYIIPNPDMLGMWERVEEVRENVRYRILDPHFGPIGDLIMRPSFGQNVGYFPGYQTKLLVVGEKFEITPFGNGVFSWAYGEDFPKSNIKIITDLKYSIDINSNKITFEFLEDKKQGYIHIRWNTAGVMDLAMSSYDPNLLQNRCTLFYDVYKK